MNQPHSLIKLPVAELKAALSGFGKVVRRSSTLPILGMIHVERDRSGWVHLTATDLDTFLSLRLEALAQMSEPARLLVPFVELQKLGKTCPVDEVLELEVLGADQLLLRVRIGSHPVEQVLTSAPVSDFPEVPAITSVSVSLDDAARATLLDALACASDDETRAILNGAYLDVSKPTGHYAVATDGRHLFASNSLHLALPTSVLIPDHRFLSWGGFQKDGQWKLSVQAPKKDGSGYLRLESRRWTFTTKQIEGTYPNWRTITEDVRAFSGQIEVSDQAVETIQRVVPRLPGDEEPNHTVGLQVQGGRLFLRGWNQGQQQTPTDVEVPGVTIQDHPATVYVNRKYLLKALGFGLHTIGVQEAMKPLRFSDGGGSRQLIVMPVRVDGYTHAPGGLRTPPPVSPATIAPAAASTHAAPDQPTTVNPNHNHHNNHPSAERNPPTMQNPANNHTPNGNAPASTAATNGSTSAEEKNSLEQALDQIDALKTSLRGMVTHLNTLADTLRQVQRDRRLSEREVRSVRATLQTLQTVRL